MTLEDVVTIGFGLGSGTITGGAQHARGLGGTAKTTCSTPRTIKLFKSCDCKQSMMKAVLKRVPPGSEHRLTRDELDGGKSLICLLRIRVQGIWTSLYMIAL